MPAKRTKKRSITLSILVGTIISAFLALFVWVAGRVEGVEFSPTHFTQREFVFWEVPILGLQVTPIYRSPKATPSINLLRSKNYIQVPQGNANSYHIVQLQRGRFDEIVLADAEILVSYLELPSGTGYAWEKWSRKHPQAAATFWPVVHRLAQRELYLIMPELFDIAEKTPNPLQLTNEIDAYLQKAYLELAEDLLAADQPELAEAVLRDALQDYPQNEPLRERLRELE